MKMKIGHYIVVCFVCLFLLVTTNVVYGLDAFSGKVVIVEWGRIYVEDLNGKIVKFRVGLSTVYEPDRKPKLDEWVRVEYFYKKGLFDSEVDKDSIPFAHTIRVLKVDQVMTAIAEPSSEKFEEPESAPVEIPEPAEPVEPEPETGEENSLSVSEKNKSESPKSNDQKKINDSPVDFGEANDPEEADDEKEINELNEKEKNTIVSKAEYSVLHDMPAKALKGEVTVKVDKASVRLGPAREYKLIAIARKGQTLVLKGKTDDWFLVALPRKNIKIGWIHVNLVRVDSMYKSTLTEMKKYPLDKKSGNGLILKNKPASF